MRHISFFQGVRHGVFGGRGGQKVYGEKVYALFLSTILSATNFYQINSQNSFSSHVLEVI